METTRQLTGLWPCGTVTRMDKVPLETTKKEATEVGNKVMWAHLCVSPPEQVVVSLHGFAARSGVLLVRLLLMVL